MFGLLHNPQRVLILYSGYGISGLGIRATLNMHNLNGIIVGIDEKPECDNYFSILDQLSSNENTMKYHFIMKNVMNLPDDFYGEISSSFDFIIASPEPENYNYVFNLINDLHNRYGYPCVIEYREEPEFYDVVLCGYQFKYNKPYHRFYEVLGFELPPAKHPCRSPVQRKDLTFGLPKHYQESPEAIWDQYFYPPEYISYIYEEFINRSVKKK